MSIKIIENHVRKEMEDLCAAHDFQHIQRVVANAKKIYEGEGKGDIFVIEAGALLHETFDEKFFEGESMEERKEKTRTFLKSLGEITPEQVDGIIFIAENVGFGKSLERGEDFRGSIEFQIVEDADRLEAIGAIAIARTFTYGGKKKRPIYDPNIKPSILKNKSDYNNNSDINTSFNHFAEKLLLLKDLMHTNTGKQLAQPRHEFMELYIKEFLAEWDGEE